MGSKRKKGKRGLLHSRIASAFENILAWLLHFKWLAQVCRFFMWLFTFQWFPSLGQRSNGRNCPEKRTKTNNINKRKNLRKGRHDTPEPQTSNRQSKDVQDEHRGLFLRSWSSIVNVSAWLTFFKWFPFTKRRVDINNEGKTIESPADGVENKEFLNDEHREKERELHANVNAQHETIAKPTERNSEFKKALSDKDKHIDISEDNKCALNAKFEYHTDTITQLNNELLRVNTKFKETIAQHEERSSKVEKELQKLKDENQQMLSETDKPIRTLKDKMLALNAQLEYRNNTITKRNNDITKFKQEVAQLTEQNSRLEKDYRQQLNNYNLTVSEHGRQIGCLKAKNQNLEDEKQDALRRLSAMMSVKLRDNNPNIADLSDQFRPTKLGEQFSELYDNEWTDAFDALQNEFEERHAICILLDIVMESYKFCDQELIDVWTFAENWFIDKNAPTVQQTSKTFKDGRKQKIISRAADVEQKYIGYLLELCKNENLAVLMKSGALRNYISTCVKLTLLMTANDPPVVIECPGWQRCSERSYQEESASRDSRDPSGKHLTQEENTVKTNNKDIAITSDLACAAETSTKQNILHTPEADGKSNNAEHDGEENTNVEPSNLQDTTPVHGGNTKELQNDDSDSTTNKQENNKSTPWERTDGQHITADIEYKTDNLFKDTLTKQTALPSDDTNCKPSIIGNEIDHDVENNNGDKSCSERSNVHNLEDNNTEEYSNRIPNTDPAEYNVETGIVYRHCEGLEGTQIQSVPPASANENDLSGNECDADNNGSRSQEVDNTSGTNGNQNSPKDENIIFSTADTNTGIASDDKEATCNQIAIQAEEVREDSRSVSAKYQNAAEDNAEITRDESSHQGNEMSNNTLGCLTHEESSKSADNVDDISVDEQAQDETNANISDGQTLDANTTTIEASTPLQGAPETGTMESARVISDQRHGADRVNGRTQVNESETGIHESQRNGNGNDNDPSAIITEDAKDASIERPIFDKDKFKEYTSRGHFVEYFVWPIIYLHRDGPMLGKGIAQGSKDQMGDGRNNLFMWWKKQF